MHLLSMLQLRTSRGTALFKRKCDKFRCKFRCKSKSSSVNEYDHETLFACIKLDQEKY
jgi:hypothetical protein